MRRLSATAHERSHMPRRVCEGSSSSVSEHDPTKCNTWHGWRVSERLASGDVLAVCEAFGWYLSGLRRA